MTKIRPGRLQEIENEDFSEFASLAYAKGFLLIYGKFLEVDVSPYLEAFETSESVTVDGYSYLQDNPAPPPSRQAVVRPRSSGGGGARVVPSPSHRSRRPGGWILGHEMDSRAPAPETSSSHGHRSLSHRDPCGRDNHRAPRFAGRGRGESHTGCRSHTDNGARAIAVPSPAPQPAPSEPEVRRAEPVNPQDLPKVRPSPAPTVRRPPPPPQQQQQQRHPIARGQISGRAPPASPRPIPR